MRVKAVVSFAGQVSAAAGEVIDLPDGSYALADLLRAGYAEPEKALGLESAKRPETRKAKQGAVKHAPE